MPDLKNRTSGPELNRSKEAFDEMVNHPDMQAENDQGDAIARDLSDSERSPEQTNGLSRGGDVAETNRAEDDYAEAPDNRFNYEKPEKQNRTTGGSAWSTKRRLFAAAAGGSGIAAIIAAFMMLLPLKVPGLMSLVTDKAGQRLEQITEKRAKLILGRAILTKFGTHTGIVLTGDGAFKTLVASMRTSGFEKRLAAKGLVIQATPDGVRLIQNGKPLKGGASLKNEKAIMDALDGDKISNRVIKDIIKEDIPTWRWMKRAKFAKWLRIKYGVPRYGLERSDKNTEEERKKDYDKQRVDSVNRRVISNFSSLITCLMSGSCDGVDSSADQSKASQTSAETDALGDVTRAADERAAEVGSRGLSRLTSKFTKLIMSAFASKAIPIVGWIDLVATVDHLVYNIGYNDYFGKMVAYYRGAAYAAIYAERAGLASQIQLGELDTAYVGEISSEFDGAEEAITFQNYDGNPGVGTAIEMKINSDSPSEVSKAFRTYVDSNLGMGYDYVFHPTMHLYYEYLGSGGLLGWLSGNIGDFASAVLKPFFTPVLKLIGAATPDSIKDLLIGTVTKVVPHILQVFGLSIDAFERGAKLFNNIVGGAEYSTNQYTKEVIGGRRLTTEQASIQNQIIAQENRAYREEKGLAYMLFSREEPTSLTSQIVYRTPSTPSATITSVGTMIASMPSKLFGILTPKTFAADGVSNAELFGIAQYGATSADLNQPLSETFLKGEECPENSENTFNTCKADQVTAEAMLCEFQPESEDCSDEDQQSSFSGSGAGQFNIASYNVLGASHSDPGGNRAEEMDSGPRMKLTIDILEKNNVSVVGFQEFENSQRKLFLDGTGGSYGIYPSNADYGSSNASINSIAWRTADFDFIRGETRPFLYFNGNNNQIPVVKLRHKQSGQEIYVTNTHDPANTSSFPKQQQYRVEDAKRHRDYISALYAKENVPIFFTGDFNSSFEVRDPQDDGLTRSELTYCILTSNNSIRNSYDVIRNNQGECPTKHGSYIDHIYLAGDVEVTDWNIVKDSQTNMASDHYPVIIGVSMGQATVGSGASKDGWVWPLQRDLKPGPCWNVSVGQLGAHAGMDINTDNPSNPVFAMHDGTIIRAGYDTYAGNYIKVKTTDGLYYIVQHLSSIEKKSGSVKASEKIGVAGKTGRVFIESSAAHLHIVVSKADDFPSYGDLKGSIDPLSVLPKPAPGGYQCTR